MYHLVVVMGSYHFEASTSYYCDDVRYTGFTLLLFPPSFILVRILILILLQIGHLFVSLSISMYSSLYASDLQWLESLG